MIGFKTYAIIILFLLMNEQTSFSQVNNKPINYRFETKEKGLIDLIQNNVKYPTSSINDKTVGISVSSITITPNGDIEKIAIINSVDKAIDKEVIRLLKMTKTNWTKCDTISFNQSFYV